MGTYQHGYKRFLSTSEMQGTILRFPQIERSFISEQSVDPFQIIVECCNKRISEAVERSAGFVPLNPDPADPETFKSILSLLAYKSEQLGVAVGDVALWLRIREDPILKGGHPGQRLVKLPTLPRVLTR